MGVTSSDHYYLQVGKLPAGLTPGTSGTTVMRPTAVDGSVSRPNTSSRPELPESGLRCNIWSRELEWFPDSDQISTLKVKCTVSTSKNDRGEPAVSPDNWPSKMIMHLIPKYLLAETKGSRYFIDFKCRVQFPGE